MESPDTETQSGTRYDAFIFLTLGLLALFALTLLRPLDLNVDSTMYLEIGRYLLEGRLPYVDYIELNPPLIHYISIIPVFLADLSGLNPILVYRLMMFVCVVYSVLITRYLVLKLTGKPYSLTTNIISIITIIVTIESLADEDAAFSMFGQREHLLSLLVIPWLVLRPLKAMKTPVPITVSITIGVLAAIGIALKPFLVLPLLVIELYFLIKYHNWRVMFSPEVWAFATVGVLYLVHFFILPPAVRDNFFNNLIPTVTENYESYRLGSILELIETFLRYPNLFVPGIVWIIGLGLAIIIPRKQDNQLSSLFITFTLFSIGAILNFLIQGIGFGYHTLPFYFTVFSAIMIRIQTDIGQSNVLLTKLLNLFFICLIIILTGYTGFLNSVGYSNTEASLPDYILSESEFDDTVFFVDTSLWPAYPLLVQIDRQSNYSYAHAFPIAFGLYQHENPEALYEPDAVLPEEIESYLSILATDIEDYQPTLIFIISADCQSCPDNFNIHRMLLANGFIDTHILPDYVRDNTPSITDFIIYKRQ